MVTGSQKVHWSLVVSHFQGIEQLKKEERRWAKKTKWMNMRAVFGHHFSILWFSPFSTPDHGKAETYQYVVWELSAGNKADRSKVKEGRWVQPQKAMLNTINTRASHGQPAICFLCRQLSVLNVFVLPWLSAVAERKKTRCESCLQTLMNLFHLFLSILSGLSFHALCSLIFQCQLKQTFLCFFKCGVWC